MVWEKRVFYLTPLVLGIMVIVGISWSTPMLHIISLGKYQTYINAQLEQKGISIEIGIPPWGSNQSFTLDVSAGVYNTETNQTRWNEINQATAWLINQTELFKVSTVYQSPPPPPVPFLAPGAAVVWWFEVNETIIKLTIGIEIS